MIRRRVAASSWVSMLFIYGLVVGFAETSQPNNHGVQHMIQWGTIANWVEAVTTFILAAVAVFQETIRGWFYHPTFRVSIKAEPPDCVAVPFTTSDGTFVANSIYLKLWIENIGNAAAKNVEVYATELRKLADGEWRRISALPPMNLKWAHIGVMYFPTIAPQMGKHCDLGHIVDPLRRHLIPRENAPLLELTDKQTSLAFDLIAPPNNKCYIVGPGDYQVDILVAAENAGPIKRTIELSLLGTWNDDETKMLHDGVGVSLLSVTP